MNIASELHSEIEAKAEAMNIDFETTVATLLRIGLKEQNRRERESAEAKAVEPVHAKSTTTAEERILEIAIDAFDDEHKATEWLREPNIRTGNRPPLELIDTPQGFHAVEVVLNQIKYAIFA